MLKAPSPSTKHKNLSNFKAFAISHLIAIDKELQTQISAQ